MPYNMVNTEAKSIHNKPLFPAYLMLMSVLKRHVIPTVLTTIKQYNCLADIFSLLKIMILFPLFFGNFYISLSFNCTFLFSFIGFLHYHFPYFSYYLNSLISVLFYFFPLQIPVVFSDTDMAFLQSNLSYLHFHLFLPLPPVRDMEIHNFSVRLNAA